MASNSYIQINFDEFISGTISFYDEYGGKIYEIRIELVRNSTQPTHDCTREAEALVQSTPNYISPHIVYIRYLVALISLCAWLTMCFSKTDLGKDVFGYKGNNKLLKIRHHLAVYAWWWQTSLILLSLTYHNNVLIDSCTIVATLVFGGPFFMEYPIMRRKFGLNNKAWDYFFTLITLFPHHASITAVILFESDANKVLYRPILFWLWLCHGLYQVVVKYRATISQYICIDTMWDLYWKTAPYLISFWYIRDFQQSDNEYFCAGLLMLFFGRWVLSFNWPEKASWPKSNRWKGETVQSILHLAMAYVYCHGFEVSVPMAFIYAAFVCYLQQAQQSQCTKNINYSWSK